MRLYSYIKNFANLTKAELTKLQEENRIRVNGYVIPLATFLKDKDIVTIDDTPILPIPFVYYLYYKPRGILSTISNREESYIHHISLPYKVSPAGRLDKESEGLLLLSNNGSFLNEITDPKTHYEKEYLVTVKNKITTEFMEGIQKSYSLDGRETRPILAKQISDYSVSMILSEGLYHQIRRIVKLNQNYVTELKRIRVGSYLLGDMKPGDLIEIKK